METLEEMSRRINALPKREIFEDDVKGDTLPIIEHGQLKFGRKCTEETKHQVWKGAYRGNYYILTDDNEGWEYV